MARVYISIGSNVDRERNIRSCLRELRHRFGPLTVSSVYESESVGFDGDPFYNLVVGFDTDEEIPQLAESLRRIEDAHGRVRTGPRFSSRTLDLDLLLYDDVVRTDAAPILPREEITENAFVLWPLAEIAGDHAHPVLGKTYAELWAAFDRTKQRLWVVEFRLDEEA